MKDYCGLLFNSNFEFSGHPHRVATYMRSAWCPTLRGTTTQPQPRARQPPRARRWPRRGHSGGRRNSCRGGARILRGHGGGPSLQKGQGDIWWGERIPPWLSRVTPAWGGREHPRGGLRGALGCPRQRRMCSWGSSGEGRAWHRLVQQQGHHLTNFLKFFPNLFFGRGLQWEEMLTCLQRNFIIKSQK